MLGVDRGQTAHIQGAQSGVSEWQRLPENIASIESFTINWVFFFYYLFIIVITVYNYLFKKTILKKLLPVGYLKHFHFYF